MGKSYSKPNIHIMKLQTCLILAFATFSLASPLIQDRTLVAGEKQIRLKLEEVYTELNLENAADAARETSQQVVAIFADGTSTVAEFNTDAISEKIDEISALAESSYTTYSQRVQSMIGEQRDNIRGVIDGVNDRVQVLGENARDRVQTLGESAKEFMAREFGIGADE